MKRILAIDYGRVNLGFAFTESMIADPIAGVKVKTQDDLLTSVLSITQEYQPELIIVGLPEGPLEQEVRSFAAELATVVKSKIVLHPETLSTQEAVTKLREGGAKRKKLQNDHSYAAALILEDYITSQTEEAIT